MSIKSKLLLVLGLVMGFLIFNMVQMSYESLSEKKRLAQTMTLIELSEKLSLFIHETQKERGMSAGFLGSSGKKFGDTLVSQRSLTDKTLKELFTFVEAMDF